LATTTPVRRVESRHASAAAPRAMNQTVLPPKPNFLTLLKDFAVGE